MPIDMFPKATLLDERVTAGAAPVPERATLCGLPVALSTILTRATLLPVTVGVKVTPIVQLAPAATLIPQLFV